MDLMKDKHILGHIAKKRRVICALVVGLAAFATSIAATTQEAEEQHVSTKEMRFPFISVLSIRIKLTAMIKFERVNEPSFN